MKVVYCNGSRGFEPWSSRFESKVSNPLSHDVFCVVFSGGSMRDVTRRPPPPPRKIRMTMFSYSVLYLCIRMLLNIGVGDGGQGALCPPPQKKRIADVITRANFGQISGKFRQNSGKFRTNSGKFWANSGRNGNTFCHFCCCSPIIFAGITCRISCTPRPILKYRTVSGARWKKRCTSPPPPPPPPAQRGFQSAGGIRAKRTQIVCAPHPPPPPTPQKKMNWYRTLMLLNKTQIAWYRASKTLDPVVRDFALVRCFCPTPPPPPPFEDPESTPWVFLVFTAYNLQHNCIKLNTNHKPYFRSYTSMTLSNVRK